VCLKEEKEGEEQGEGEWGRCEMARRRGRKKWENGVDGKCGRRKRKKGMMGRCEMKEEDKGRRRRIWFMAK
jgi:hypothetical protein